MDYGHQTFVEIPMGSGNMAESRLRIVTIDGEKFVEARDNTLGRAFLRGLRIGRADLFKGKRIKPILQMHPSQVAICVLHPVHPAESKHVEVREVSAGRYFVFNDKPYVKLSNAGGNKCFNLFDGHETGFQPWTKVERVTFAEVAKRYSGRIDDNLPFMLNGKLSSVKG
jgi:hypothetical protein